MDHDRYPYITLPSSPQGRWNRRRFLRFAAGGAALLPLGMIGCGGDETAVEPSEVVSLQTPTQAPVRTSTTARAESGATQAPEPPATTAASTPEPTLEPTPPQPALSVELQPSQVGIGESMYVRAVAPAASSVLIDFRDVVYRMVDGGDGSFWLAVGVALDASAGPGVLTTSARDATGATLASFESTYQVVPVERPVDYLTVTEETAATTLTAEAAAQESWIRGLQFSEFEAVPRWLDLFLRPVDGPITTFFGQGRSINGGPVGAFHTGVDLANDEGTPVQVAAPGIVSWVGDMPVRGGSVVVDHGGGVKTGYHHLSAKSASVGQVVQTGDVVGLVGMTGLATGPHLHWELTLWGVNVDPMTWTTQSFRP